MYPLPRRVDLLVRNVHLHGWQFESTNRRQRPDGTQLAAMMLVKPSGRQRRLGQGLGNGVEFGQCMLEFLKSSPLSVSRLSNQRFLLPLGNVVGRCHFATKTHPEIVLHDAVADAPRAVVVATVAPCFPCHRRATTCEMPRLRPRQSRRYLVRGSIRLCTVVTLLSGQHGNEGDRFAEELVLIEINPKIELEADKRVIGLEVANETKCGILNPAPNWLEEKAVGGHAAVCSLHSSHLA
jgi:hypothetical protein